MLLSRFTCFPSVHVPSEHTSLVLLLFEYAVPSHWNVIVQPTMGKAGTFLSWVWLFCVRSVKDELVCVVMHVCIAYSGGLNPVPHTVSRRALGQTHLTLRFVLPT